MLNYKHLLPIVALAVAVGCGGDDTSGRKTVGNSGGNDTGSSVDGGGDTGVGTDTGSGTDTGTIPDTGPGGDTGTTDTGGTDTGTTDTGGTDTGTTDTGTMDGGDTDGGMSDVGMRMKAALVPLGHYGIGGNFAITGRVVPGPGANRIIKNGNLVVETVTLQPK